MFLTRKLDTFLNGITMYRLVLYGLGIISAAAIISSLMDILAYPVTALIISLSLAIGTCYVTSSTLSHIWKVPANTESWLITALILFCILPPANTIVRVLAVILASIAAIAPRYLMAIGHRHALNPAAAGAFTVSILGMAHSAWWIGTPVLLPFTVIVGLLIVRKMRRFAMFSIFVLAAGVTLALYAFLHDRSLANLVSQALVSGPLIFLGTIMLTEPTTMPPRFRQQLLYGAIVGTLLMAHLKIGSLSITPEIALLVGNCFAYMLGQKYRPRLTLVKKIKLSDKIYDFSLMPDHMPDYKPGQYMEWTLQVPHTDDRGNRRTFTIASSPTESELHLGVKFYEPSSAFKKALHAMEPGNAILGSQIAGDFILPQDSSKKLVFIAGGIGITPFRSMLKYLTDIKQTRDIILFYAVSDPADISYWEVLESAKAIGLQIVLVLTNRTIPVNWQGETGSIDKTMLSKNVSDYAERYYYLSGPNAMVEGYTKLVKSMGVPGKRIKADHFSGY